MQCIDQSVFEDCTFAENETLGGGGAANGGTYLRCTFFANSAVESAGALGAAHAIECRFEANEVTVGHPHGTGGGAAAECLLEDCTLIGNESRSWGGGASFCDVRGGEALYNRLLPGSQFGASLGAGLYYGSAEGVRIHGNHGVGHSFGGGVFRTLLRG